ncbi:MAG: general secretion pathway protein GspK [Gemmatimonadaceae bacterium]
MTHARAERQSGFALLAVLWVIVGLAALGVATSLAARNAIIAAGNRVDIARATWRAADCLERARASVADVLHAPPERDARGLSGWSGLEARVPSALIVSGAHCDVRLEAVGSRIDVNSADGEMIGALLHRLGIPDAMRDSMVDALLDWRDADDVPRPHGAERQWYAASGRFTPRNGPFADVREIARVRGFEKLHGLDSLLSVEPGRVSLALAPLSVLAALPGIGEEALSRVAEQRARGAGSGDLMELTAELSPGARQRVLARYSELVHAATSEPDAWILEARATTGSPAITVVIQVRLVRAGDRAAIVRRRTWIA